MRRNLVLVCLALGSVVALGCVEAESAERFEKGPNVLIVWVDDLGALDTGVYGSSLYETPAIDRLAGEGARFEFFYSASSVCSPTRASLMTGKHPARLRLTNWIGGEQKGALIQADYERSLPLEELTLGEAFGQAGYATAYLGKWHLGAEGHLPAQQGFEVSVGVNEAGQPASYFWPYRRASPSVWDVPGLASGERDRSGEYLTDRLTAEALGFLEDHVDRDPERPFFLVLSHYAVHTPIEAPADAVKDWQARVDSLPPAPDPATRSESGLGSTELHQRNATYAAMVSAVDRSVERLVASLGRLGVAENTIVVVVSDNGGLSTLAGERRAPTSNEPLRAGKGWLYEGGVRIPMIVRWPGRIAQGTVVDVPATTTDIYPTLLELAGLEALPEQHVDGLSLAGVLRGEAAPVRDALFWHFPHYHGSGNRPSSSIRDAQGLKLIEWLEDGRVELYDLVADPEERVDLAPMRPAEVARLRRQLEALRSAVGAAMPTPNPDWPDAGG